MSQASFSDIDIIMTTLTDFDQVVNLNKNQYALDPFAEMSSIGSSSSSKDTIESDTSESDLTSNLFGFDIMSTKNIRQKISESEVGERIEGVSGRWTIFTKLHSADPAYQDLSINVFAIDSRAEIKIGIGRLFESKKVIGER